MTSPLPFVRRRHSVPPASAGDRARKALIGALVVLTVCLFPGPSPRAQTGATLPGILLNRFNPSSPGSDWFTLDSLDFRGRARPAIRVGFDWGEKLLEMQDADGNGVADVVERQLILHVGLAITLVERVRLGLDQPILLDEPGSAGQVGLITYPAPDSPGVGDLRAAADVRLFGQYGDPFRLSAGIQVFFPTGKQANYVGDGVVRAFPRVGMAGDVGLFSYAVNLGFMSRDEIDEGYFQGIGITHELYGAAAAGVRPVPEVLLGAELTTFSALSEDFFKKRATPAELIFGGHFLIAKQLRFAVGAGPGLTKAFGSPQLRFLARLEWSPPVGPDDRDGDGVMDDVDACPDSPGIRTGDPATNGCPPPPDRDNDGVSDNQDACPDEPGVATDDPGTNGCPAPTDRDGDGVLDPADACPDAPGEPTDDPGTNGCPPPDRDNDGVLDRDDACPDKAGSATDDSRTSGCPDGDGDGILDPLDACPEQAGNPNADPTKNGCPLARVEKGQVRITEQVQFKTGSATILPESDPLLQAVAQILRDNPDIKKVRVEGHTDNRGGKAMNRRLSRRRAASVARWLTKAGIEKGRLVSEGFGMDRPIADNETEEGRQQNRRVEFHIVDPPPAP